MSDDLISRKAAITEIARWIGYLDEDMINRIQIGLKRLPSSQSEWDDLLIICGNCDHTIHVSKRNSQHIIRCKDCKYASPNGIYGCRLERFSPHDKSERLFSNDFCSFAEVKADEND